MTQDEKSQAMLMWLLCLVINIFSPIIFMLVGKDKPGVYRSAMQALTFYIVMIILYFAVWIVVFLLALVTHGFGIFLMIPIFGVLGLFGLYVIIMGAVESNKGNVFEPPITSNFARAWFKV
ncbi:MAG TPA: DUF4870 domain-containing protein [Fimbriimonadaceae bacterium]|jgi:uncharacterized Tic20 family protein